MDRVEPVDPDDPLLNRVNVLRGVEWFKAKTPRSASIGMADTGALTRAKGSVR